MQKEKNEKANRKRFLLINADDFGYCEERDEGFIFSFLLVSVELNVFPQGF